MSSTGCTSWFFTQHCTFTLAAVVLLLATVGSATPQRTSAGLGPPPSKISTNTKSALWARLATAADERTRVAMLSDAPFSELIALSAEQRAAAVAGAKNAAEAQRLLGEWLPPIRFAPMVDLDRLTPVPPFSANNSPPPEVEQPTQEERVKLQKIKDLVDAGGVITSGNASIVTKRSNGNGRAFAGAAFEIDFGVPAYVVLPGSYWVRFRNGFYMCAYENGQVVQTPRMLAWERITVLPGPEPGTSYLYSNAFQKFIIDNRLWWYGADQTTKLFQYHEPIPPVLPFTYYRYVRINGAPVNAPQAAGVFPYRVISPRFNGVAPSLNLVESTYLQAPTAGEYHDIFFRDEPLGTVPPTEVDFISVRTLAPGDFWVRTHHGQFMCVHQDHVAAGSNQQAWERIQVIKADEGEYGRNRYHLWNDAHQRYLAFEHNGLGLRTYTQSWETFRIVSHPTHFESFSIFSDFHGKFLRQACHGCGFDATLSNTNPQQDRDATAFDFLPIGWSPVSGIQSTITETGAEYSSAARTAQKEEVGTPVTEKVLKLPPSLLQFSMIVINKTRFISVVARASGSRILLSNGLPDTLFPVTEQAIASSLIPNNGSYTRPNKISRFHDILAHPKIPRRYVIRLCTSSTSVENNTTSTGANRAAVVLCRRDSYLAASPEGNAIATTEDVASDYTAAEMIF